MIIFVALILSICSLLYAEEGIIPKEYIKTFLPEDPVIFEAGAHWGSDTVEMNTLLPKSTIYAFEPVPEIYEQLCFATRFCPNVHCYQLALADYTGQAMLFVSSGASDGSSSILRPTGHLTEHPNVYFNRIVHVKTTILDEWAEHMGVDHIDFMWLDMQGAEYAMLRASPRILSTVKVIYTEVSLKEMYEHCPLYPEFRAWLEGQGFEVVREELPWADMGNVLFVRRS